MTFDNWPLRAKHILKTELKRRRISYSDLAHKLAAIGIEEDEKNLAKKISRGGFKAAFLFQCLEAIGCESLHLRLIILAPPPDPLRRDHAKVGMVTDPARNLRDRGQAVVELDADEV